MRNPPHRLLTPLGPYLIALMAGLWLGDRALSAGAPPPDPAQLIALSLCVAALAVALPLPTPLFRLLTLSCWAAAGVALAPQPLEEVPWPTSKQIWEGPVVAPPEVGAFGCRLKVLLPPAAHPTLLRAPGGCHGAREGDRVRFEGVVNAPALAHFPGEGQRLAEARRAGVVGLAYVGNKPLVVLAGGAPESLRDRLAPTQAELRRWILAEAPEQASSILLALVLGQKDTIDDPTREAFSASGLAHVLAISGLHVAGLGLGLAALLRWLVALVWPGRGGAALANGLGLLFACGYASLAGLPTSAVRALLMTSVALAGRTLGLRTQPVAAVTVTCALMLAWQPTALWDLGFQLSVGSVTALLLLTGPLTRLTDGLVLPQGAMAPRRSLLARGAGRLVAWVWGVLAASLAATAGTSPLLAWHFHAIPLIGPVANLAGLTLLGTLAVPLAVGGAALHLAQVPGAPEVLLGLASRCVQAGVAVALYFGEPGRFPSLTPWPSELETLAMGFAVVAVALLIHRRFAAGLATLGLGAMALLAPQAVAAMTESPPPAMTLTLLAVGQGDALLVQTPDGEALLVDAGGALFSSPDAYDPGRFIVVPALHAMGITRLRALILTHPHPDHMGGMGAVLDALPVDELWMADPNQAGFAELLPGLTRTPAPDGAGWVAQLTQQQTQQAPGPLLRLLLQAQAAGVQLRTLSAGDHLDIGGVSLTALHPSAQWPPPKARKKDRSLNNGSLTLRLTYAGHSALLSGDIEAAAEASLTGPHGPPPAQLDVDVLKVPHHGSSTSTTQALLEATTPAWALISVGRNNSFDFPRADVVSRLEGAGAQVLRSDRRTWRLSFSELGIGCEGWQTGWGWRQGCAQLDSTRPEGIAAVQLTP